MFNSKSPSINLSPSASPSQNKNENEDENDVNDGWVTMTEISISSNGDIECSSPPRGSTSLGSLSKDPNPALPSRKERTLPANKITYTSSMVNFEALPGALRHVELERMIHHQSGVEERLCLVVKSGYGNGTDVHGSSDMDMDMGFGGDGEDEAGHETESNYTFAPIITHNEMSPNSNPHPPHRCQSPLSNIPRTPHRPTPLEFNQFLPKLPPPKTKATHHQGYPPLILHPAKILAPQSKPSKKFRKQKQKQKQKTKPKPKPKQRQQQNSIV